MISDRKAMRAVETLRVYCDERGCKAKDSKVKCMFSNDVSNECAMQVRCPAYFPKYDNYGKSKQNVNKCEKT